MTRTVVIYCSSCKDTLATLPTDLDSGSCEVVKNALHAGHVDLCKGKPVCPHCQCPVENHVMDSGPTRVIYCPRSTP